MESPYLNRLVARRDGSSDETERATASAEVGMYLARCGGYADAQEIATALRAAFGHGGSGRVTVRLMVLEAFLAYYRDLSPQAHDRMSRAQFLSVAGRDRQLIALTSAWLAHIDFNLGRYGEMLRAVRACLDAVAATELDTVCRLSLTLADAFLYCGERDAARAWYDKARESAAKLGDHASIGATTYNQAALGVFMARLQSIREPIDSVRLRGLVGDVNNAVNYQAIARLSSLQGLLDSAVISVSILQGDYARACARVEELIAADLRIAITAVSAALRSDLTLCLAALGKDEEAQHNLELIPDSQLDALNSDDRALALESLARACDCMTLGEKGRGYRARRDSALLEHDQEVAQVRAAIAPLVDANAVIGRTAARSA